MLFVLSPFHVLLGKILLVNTLMGSLYTYKLSVLPPVSKEQCKQFYKIVKDFLWNGKKPKIPTRILCLDKNKGGQKLVNLENRQKSLYIQWIPLLCRDDSFDYVYDIIAPVLRKDIWNCNLHSRDVQNIVKQDSFWKMLLTVWAEVQKNIKKISRKLNSSLYGTTQNGKLAQKLLPLLNENEKVMSFASFCKKHDVSNRNNSLWIWYNTGLPHYWKALLENDKAEQVHSEYISIDQLVHKKTGTSSLSISF